MAEDLIGYQGLIERALRGVVREALAGVAADGLPGRHHLYVTFRTDHPGVVVSDPLRARYPREMTIVLQHEFWNLEVEDEGFGVTLTFGGVPHRLWIPFTAVKLFTDPAAEFGLQFAVPEPEEGEGEGTTPGEEGEGVPLPSPLAPSASADEAGPGGRPGAGKDRTEPAEEAGEGEAAEGEKVVSLDRFRSK